jgi:phosphohistidine phosphatase
MDIYILRHAIAAEPTPGQSDFDRPLTPEGKKKLQRITKACRNLDLSFDRVISSPYVRARETAEMVTAALAPRRKLELWDSLGAEGNPREFIVELRKLRPAPQSVLVVGHEPYLSSLIALLVCGSTHALITLKKAGLCKLATDSLQPARCARLEWLLTPRQLVLMS